VKDPYEEAKKAMNNIMSSAVAKKTSQKEMLWMGKEITTNHRERNYCEICNYNNHQTKDCWWREDNDNTFKNQERDYCEICKKNNHRAENCWWNEENKENCLKHKKKEHIAENCKETDERHATSYFQKTYRNQVREYCNICHKDNHQAKDCWWNEENKDRCFKCKKKGHIAKNCQETEERHATSYFQNIMKDNQLMREDLLAILDTGSRLSVVGELWLATILTGMSKEDLSFINKSQRKKEGVITFGTSNYKIIKEINIPCKIRDKEFNVRVSVVEGNIPMLLGIETMNKMKLIHNVWKKSVDINDLKLKNIRTIESETGHACISLGKLSGYFHLNGNNEEWIHQNKENRKDKLLRLHLQFAHSSTEKMIKLIKDAYDSRIKRDKLTEMEMELRDINKNQYMG
jgi:hypothetical protein